MTRTRTTQATSHRSAFKPEERVAQSDKNSTVMELTASEMRADMVKILTHIKMNLDAQQRESSTFLATSIQALLYAERVASYALHDYPRQFEGDTHITPLWDTFNRIVRTVTAWRTGKSGGDGQVELVIIRKSIDLALEESQQR